MPARGPNIPGRRITVIFMDVLGAQQHASSDSRVIRGPRERANSIPMDPKSEWKDPKSERKDPKSERKDPKSERNDLKSKDSKSKDSKQKHQMDPKKKNGSNVAKTKHKKSSSVGKTLTPIPEENSNSNSNLKLNLKVLEQGWIACEFNDND
jgi:hypothetical protein